MAHTVFIVLHLIAVLFGWILLFVTIPAHLIYTAVSRRGKGGNGPTPDTHVKCPDCRELVLNEANVCKHCGCKLVPQISTPA
jgi:hypothetical protein